MFEWLRGIVKIPAMEVKGFPKNLTKDDFQLANNSTQSIVAGVWNTIGAFKVPAQQKFRFGYGKASEPDNQGYLYIDLKDTSATPVQIEGMIRLVYADASLLKKSVIYEENTRVLRGSTTDKKLMKPLPETINTLRPDGYAGEDDYLLIELKPESSATLSKANSTVFIPATQIA
jgi:hypothetical protein